MPLHTHRDLGVGRQASEDLTGRDRCHTESVTSAGYRIRPMIGLIKVNMGTKYLIFKKIVTLFFAIPATEALVHGAEIDHGGWYVEMAGMGSTKRALPFWSHTNKGGVYPETCGGLFRGGVNGTSYGKNTFRLDWGIGLAGYAAAEGNAEVHNSDGSSTRGMVQELYVGTGWKKLNLDLGIRRRATDFGGLSVTGGNFVLTDNAQSFPGYRLHSDWIKIPFTKGILSARFDFGDYGLWDNRYVKHTLLHNQALHFKVNISKRISFTGGLDLWTQWGGTSPVYGKQPHKFSDYLKIMVAASGGEGATKSDRINALGNHLGRELLRLDLDQDRWRLAFQHDRPFEDGSGVGFQNFPDAVNTLHLSFKNKDKWVSDLLLEFIYTKWQSGTRHDRPATEEELKRDPDKKVYIVGGCDNYFNNGEYQSAWTYNGRSIGLPLFTLTPKDENGITKGVSNNRIIAWNVGLGGKLFRKVPYLLKVTYSKNFGKYSQSDPFYNSVPRQVSGALELTLPKRVIGNATLLSIGLYADKGSIYPDTAGITLRLGWGGTLTH